MNIELNYKRKSTKELLRKDKINLKAKKRINKKN